MDDNEHDKIPGAEIIARYTRRIVESRDDPAVVALRAYFEIAAQVAETVRRRVLNSDSTESKAQDTIR